MEILKELSSKESKHPQVLGTAAWISQGIDIQVSQYLLSIDSCLINQYQPVQYRENLKRIIKKSKKYRSRNGKNPYFRDVKRKRDLLLAQVEEFNQWAEPLLRVGGNTEDMDKKIHDDNSEEGDGSSADEEDADIVISSEDEDIVTSDSEEEDIGSDGESVCEEGMIEPENMALQLPSTIGKEACIERGLNDLMDQEIQLRNGQANNSLQQLREELGHKSWLYKEKRSHGRVGQKASLRSWSAIKKSGETIKKHVATYTLAFKALARLDATEMFRPIEKKDLKLNADITDENRFGQSSDILSWIWTTGTQSGGKNSSLRAWESA